jgi:hypothetical protein
LLCTFFFIWLIQGEDFDGETGLSLKEIETVKGQILLFNFEGCNFIPVLHDQGSSELPFVNFVELLFHIIPVQLFLKYDFEACTLLILPVLFDVFHLGFIIVELHERLLSTHVLKNNLYNT